MSALLRFPLKRVIPLALILFACTISVFLAAFNFARIDGQVEQEIRERVVQLMTRTQGTLRNLSRKGDDGGLQLEISQLGSDPLVESAALLDESNTILYATQYRLTGKKLLDEYPDVSQPVLDDVRDTNVGIVMRHGQRQSFLAWYPVELWTENSSLGSARPGLLFLSYDLHLPQSRAHQLLVQQLIQFSLVICAFSALLWLAFHYGLTRRVDRLVKSVNRFGEGDITARANLDGHDELAELGSAFDNMVEVIIADRHRLADSEGRMRAILNNASDCILSTDREGIIQTANPALEYIFGYRADNVIGRHLGILLAPAYQRLQYTYMADKRAGHDPSRHLTIEAQGRRKDGSEVILEVTATDFELDGERLFVWILRDISERRKVDRMKNEFVSVVSHELRTPLTSIIGSLGLLNGGTMGEIPAQAKQLLGIALNNSERLVRLINDILDIEKIESGQLAISDQVVDLDALIQQAVESNRGFGEKYAVRFVVQESLPGACVRGDPDRLMQVLVNLLSNAAKYSPPHAAVHVGISRHDDFLRIKVRDEGPGIPASFRDRLFEKFTQADSSDTRQKDGTGLGLSIARSIVELHGGSISFNSPDSGGSEFFFDLPEHKQASRVIA